MKKNTILISSNIILLLLIIFNLFLGKFENISAGNKATGAGKLYRNDMYNDISSEFIKELKENKLTFSIFEGSNNMTETKDSIYLGNDLDKAEVQDTISILIGKNPIAVCGSKKRTINNISEASLKKILTGEIIDWSEIGDRAGRIVLLINEDTKLQLERTYNINIDEPSMNSENILKLLPKDENAFGLIQYNNAIGDFKLMNIDNKSIQDTFINNKDYPIYFNIVLRINKGFYLSKKANFDASIDFIKRTKIYRIVFS